MKKYTTSSWTGLPLRSVAFLGLTLSGFQAIAKPKEVPVIVHKPDQTISSLLAKSSGQLSASLKKAFLAKQKKETLKNIKLQGKSVDNQLLEWIDNDQDATDAVYGTICPADPEILLNLNQLWQEQGASFTKKYKHLSLAAAVARRGMGVGQLGQFGKWGAVYGKAQEARATGQDPAVALVNGKNTTEHLLPQDSADKAAFKAVSSYLKENNITNRQAIEDENHFAKVESLIKAAGSNMKVIHVTKGLLITQGQRPKARTTFPKVSDYYKFLVKLIETPSKEMSLEDGQRWPIFPTTTAPWPIMMPITHGLPLDEAQYIVEKYQGKHDGKRLHNYGPYRKGKKAFHPTFEDRQWHWRAYPSVIKEGGVCGTMSTISMTAYTALGKPIMKAGQPKHSCTVGYSVSSDGKFIAGVGQSATAGPDGTGTNWLFQDGAAWHCYGNNTNAIFHYGLALSMNPGLESYMNSRISLHIYRHLSPNEKNTVGRKLLLNSLKKNPFNTEIWYTLAYESPDMKSLLAVLEEANDLLISSAAAEDADDKRDASAAIEGAEKASKSKKHSAGIIATYKRYVIQAIIANAFAKPEKFNKSDQKAALSFLKKHQGGKNKEITLAYDRFRVAVTGSQQIKQEIQEQLDAMLKPAKGKKRKSPKQLAGNLKKSFMQIDQLILDRQEREEWLLNLLKEFPKEKAAAKNKKGKVKLDPVFAAIASALSKSCKAEPHNKETAKEMNKMKKEIIKSQS